MAVKRKRISEESEESDEDLLDKLSNLEQAQLQEGVAYLLALLEEVEGVVGSGDLTELERRGFILIREYLKEAIILELRGLPKDPFIERIREVASALKEIRSLRGVRTLGEEVRIFSFDDLIKVGEVDGRPVYSIRRDERVSSDR